MSFFPAHQVEHELKAAQEVCGLGGLDDSPSGFSMGVSWLGHFFKEKFLVFYS